MQFALVPALVLMLAAASAPPGFAQGSRYEGMEVAGIRFEPPEQPLDPAELQEMLPLKARQPLRMADVRASIERLYATGCYEDI